MCEPILIGSAPASPAIASEGAAAGGITRTTAAGLLAEVVRTVHAVRMLGTHPRETSPASLTVRGPAARGHARGSRGGQTRRSVGARATAEESRTNPGEIIAARTEAGMKVMSVRVVAAGPRRRRRSVGLQATQPS